MLAIALITSKAITLNEEKDSHSVCVDCEMSVFLLSALTPCNLLSNKTCWAGMKTRDTCCIFSGLCDLQPDVRHYMEFISGVWELAGGERLSWVNTHTHPEDTNTHIWKVKKRYKPGGVNMQYCLFFFFFSWLTIYVIADAVGDPISCSVTPMTHTNWEVYIWLRLAGWSLPGFLNSNVISHSALGLMGHAVEYLVWSETIRVPLLPR